jgi:hypothetical protein
LFQDRYLSKAVESDEYLLSATRYIHQNPVKASLAEETHLFKWSSASAYLDGGNSLVDAGFVLSLFSENADEQLAAYKNYLQKDDDIEHLGESAKRLSDGDAREIMNRLCGTSTVAEFQEIPSDKRGDILI